MADDPLTPPFASKIAVVVCEDLKSWQRLNVTAFLISGIAAAHPELVGEAYQDADGQRYLPLLCVPVLVFEAAAETLRSARANAAQRQLPIAAYTRDMFATGHDADNRAAVLAVSSDHLDLVGIGLHGPKNVVDKIIKEHDCTDELVLLRRGGGAAGRGVSLVSLDGDSLFKLWRDRALLARYGAS